MKSKTKWYSKTTFYQLIQQFKTRLAGLVYRKGTIRHYQKDWIFRRRFLDYKRKYKKIFKGFTNLESGQRTLLIFGANFPEVEIELGLIKALEIEGFDPIALVTHKKLCEKYYELAGIARIHSLRKFQEPADMVGAREILNRFSSVQELLDYRYAGVQVGRYAASTATRKYRLGTIDLNSENMRQILTNFLARSISSAIAAHRIINKFRPHMVMIHDIVYTPEGEFFDVCNANGLEIIKWRPAHKSDALMLKRYTSENIGEHDVSLSMKSWDYIRSMEWTESHREKLQKELFDSYHSGDWYSEGGTQFRKQMIDADTCRNLIGLNENKKTAFIFPHLLWDASVNWGIDLFRDYEDWFIETVMAASKNEQVNWVIKIHPANIGRAMQDRILWEPTEVSVLKKHIDRLPNHIFLLPADSPISTLSLFKFMDFCLTVRGTIGIEAASFGIPVLTAGTGRYDQKGFTIDSKSREQYLERVLKIQEIPPLTISQRNLAERYAFGLFVMRPLLLQSITFQYPFLGKTKGFPIRLNSQINIKKASDWKNAPDLQSFVKWVIDSRQLDFLNFNNKI
jgi:hypothetical protein